VIVLGIETSCDETSVAIIDSNRKVYSHQVYSQLDDHALFGGVVPEIAARSHINILDSLVKKCISESGLEVREIDVIAATAGPGLIGGVLVGAMYAKGMASSVKKKFIAVNHLEGHALSARLIEPNLKFPFLLLLVSGGHCQIIEAQDVGSYNILGSTIDDAVGEAFDKVSKMMGLGYPGGPEIERRAKLGDAKAFKFPLPLIDSGDCNFSFSGLKTAVKRKLDSFIEPSEKIINDICASFQSTVANILVKKVLRATEIKQAKTNQIVIAGGVAANQFIKKSLDESLPNHEIISPPLWLCTDNAAMIAWAGIERAEKGLFNDLNFEPRSRWPLNESGKIILGISA
jgi:N6-L-threonylcarbamoyladenine synthase